MATRNKTKRNEIQTSLCIELQPGLNPSSVGAKSANLGTAIEHGLRVPPGCIVTCRALKLFLEHTNLLQPVQELINDASEHAY